MRGATASKSFALCGVRRHRARNSPFFEGCTRPRSGHISLAASRRRPVDAIATTPQVTQETRSEAREVDSSLSSRRSSPPLFRAGLGLPSLEHWSGHLYILSVSLPRPPLVVLPGPASSTEIYQEVYGLLCSSLYLSTSSRNTSEHRSHAP